MEYPPQVKSKKAKVAYWCFRQIYTFDQGWDFFGMATRYVPVLTSIFVMIKYFGFYDLHKTHIIVLIGLSILTCWFWGKILMKYGIDKLQNFVWSERNPIWNNMHKLLVKDEGEKY